MPTTKHKAAVTGSVYDASEAGFLRFLADANKAHADGYELVTLVRMGNKLAGVFKVRPPDPSPSFFE